MNSEVEQQPVVEQTGSAYIAKAMPRDPDEPVLTSCIGATEQAAKDGLMEEARDVIPVVIRNLDWPTDASTIEYSGYKFTVTDRAFYTECPSKRDSHV